MKMMIALMLLFPSVHNSSWALEVKSYEKKINNAYSIKTLVEKIDKKSLEEELRSLIDNGRPSRVVGSAGHKKTQTYLESKLKSFTGDNVTVSVMEFSPDVVTAGKMYQDDFNREIVAKLPPSDQNYIRWKNFTLSMINGLNKIKNNRGKNYIFEKKGKIHPDEVIILGANYDTLNHDAKTMKIDLDGKMPGADNNGTGVAALLIFAKLLSVIDTDKTIRLVFFDMEEFGFLGSKAFAETLKNNSKEKVLGFVNLVMLGNDSKVKDTAKKMGNMKLYMRSPDVDANGANLDLKLANELTTLAKKNYTTVSFEPTANGMNSSSQVSFWEQNIPAVVFTQNWEEDFNPRYHSADDFFETINFNTYFNSFRYIIFGVLCFNFGVVK